MNPFQSCSSACCIDRRRSRGSSWGITSFPRSYVAPEGGVPEAVTLDATLLPTPIDSWTHLAVTAEVVEGRTLSLKTYQDGTLVGEMDQALGDGEQVYHLVENDNPIFIGPKENTQVPPAALTLDEVKLSHVVRSAEEVRESAYANGIRDTRPDVDGIRGLEVRLGKRLFQDPRLSV